MDRELFIAVSAFIVSLLGNILQFVFPVRKTKEDTAVLVTSAAKQIVDTYKATIESLKNRIDELEKEGVNYRNEIKLLRETVENQYQEINEQRAEIEKLKSLLGNNNPSK